MSFNQAELAVTNLKGDLHKFESRGCELTHFVIWKKNQHPTDDNWFDVYPSKNEKDYYSFQLYIKNDKGIHFHVYNGSGDEGLRGKFLFPPEPSYIDNYQSQLKEYQIQIKRLKNEIEKKNSEEEKRKDEKIREEEEHKEYVNKTNNEIKILENELLNNYEIKISGKSMNYIYEQFKLSDININNMIPKNDLNQFIDKKLQDLSEEVIKKMLVESKHLNILVLGKTDVGKSTLIDSILKLDEHNKEKENFGLNILREFKEYISNERPSLRLIDSKGIEINKPKKNQTFNNVTEYIGNISKSGNSDKFVHCIWYCIDSFSKFEKGEEFVIKELQDIFEVKKLPIIFVLTKSYDEEGYSKIVQCLNKIGIIDIVPVLSKKKVISINNKKIEIKPKNLEKLIKLSFDKIKISYFTTFISAMNEKLFENIIKSFKESYNTIINFLQNINEKTNNNEDNEHHKKITMINYFNQIISEYIGKQNSKETFDLINEYTNNIFQNLDNNEEVNNLIYNYKTDFQKEYLLKRDIILRKYKVYMSEVNSTLNDNILKKIEKMVINECLRNLSSKLYIDFNKSLMGYMVEEINNRKQNEINVNIPNNLCNEIENNYNDIYKNLGELSETKNENEEEKRII